MQACPGCGSEIEPIEGMCPLCSAIIDEDATAAAMSGPQLTAASTRPASKPAAKRNDPASTNPSTGHFCGRCGSAVGAHDDYCGICGNPQNEAALVRMRQARSQAAIEPPAIPIALVAPSRPLTPYPFVTSSRTPVTPAYSRRAGGAAVFRVFAILCVLGAIVAAGTAFYLFYISVRP
jgi:uncharacterized OB-fold protein